VAVDEADHGGAAEGVGRPAQRSKGGGAGEARPGGHERSRPPDALGSLGLHVRTAIALHITSRGNSMLNVKDLFVAYGQSEALHGISFEGAKNETVAIMGRNGMGKTTLFKSLMGILPLKSGAIEVAGHDVSKDESFRRVAKGIAYVPQGRMIFPTLTVEENIQTGLENSKTRRIPDEIYALFPVLFDMRRRKGGNLSGGQQQQLAIARALVTEPKVLLLDEPTEGIQPSIIKDIAKALNEIRKLREITIVVSEQVLSFAMDVADRLFVIEGGRLVHETTRADTDVARIKQYLSV